MRDPLGEDDVSPGGGAVAGFIGNSSETLTTPFYRHGTPKRNRRPPHCRELPTKKRALSDAMIVL